MAFREQIRDPARINQLLAMPLEERRALAQQLRSQSKSANATKAEDIMDVTHEEVVRALEAYNVDTLIHGHTHRPAEREIALNNRSGRRIALGDWDQSGWLLEATPGDNGADLELRSFPL